MQNYVPPASFSRESFTHDTTTALARVVYTNIAAICPRGTIGTF